MSTPPSITCPKCQRTSYNANDIAQGYCGHCHEWTSNPDHVKPSQCPTCGYVMDSARVVYEKETNYKPKAGDFSVCAKCGELGVFKADQSVRPAELNDLTTLTPFEQDQLRVAQLTIRKLRPLDK